MIIDLSVLLRDLDNKPLDRKLEDGKVTAWDIGGVFIHALTSSTSTTEKDKLDDYNLALKIKDADIVKDSSGIGRNKINLTIDEITHIKSCIGKVFNNLVYGQVYHILEDCGGKGTLIKIDTKKGEKWEDSIQRAKAAGKI